MPEGPELARSRDFLQKMANGKHLDRFEIVGGRYKDHPPEGFREFKEALAKNPMFIDSVNVKGKFMWWGFFSDDRTPWHMWCTYGMSGRWTTEPVDEHVAATMRVIGPKFEAVLNFRDPRHFGTLKFVNNNDKTTKKLATLGPDMLNDPPDLETFELRLGKRVGKTIAEALMDQSVVSGVGNYIKAEALYLAELSPHRLVSSLQPHERRVLREQIINVMRASYNTGGATISTYRQANGNPGEAQRRFVVYGNSTDPFGNPVIKEETLDGRTTHWVPAIQK